MDKRYIIELPENTEWVQWIESYDFDGMPLTGMKKPEELTPYNSISLEQVKKDYDAYYEHGYEVGLADAWEAARKVITMWCKMDNQDLLDVFGSYCPVGESVLTNLYYGQTALEAIAKIKDYEGKQKEIEVGDEVTEGNHNACALYENPDGTQVTVLKQDGTTAWWCKSAIYRTGRHFHEIAAVLKKMRGEQE